MFPLLPGYQEDVSPFYNVNDLIAFLYFSYRNCFNYDSHCSRLWTLHSSSPCKSDWLLLVLAGYHIHLALFIGLDWSTSFGLEQIHTGNSWIRLLSGLEVKRPQWHLLCALFFPWLSGCTCCDHGLLLWTYSICSKNGKLMDKTSFNEIFSVRNAGTTY